MLLIQEIRLENFLSHKDTVLELKENDKRLLSGRSGSGKSALVDALIWVLYGRGRVDNRSLIRKGEKGASVSVILENDGVEYKIERKITKSGKHELAVYEKVKTKFMLIEANGVREMQEYIEKDILKASYLLFINSIIYPQDNSNSFVNQSAAKRKDLILEIIDAGSYDEYYERAKKVLKDKQIDVVTVDTKIEVGNSLLDKGTPLKSLEVDKKKLKKLAEDIGIWENILVTSKGIEKKNDRLDKELYKLNMDSTIVDTGIKVYSENILVYEENIKKINGINVKDLEKKIKGFENLRDMIDSMERKERLFTMWNDRYIDLVNTKPIDRDYEGEIKELNTQLITVMTRELPVCKKCKTPYEEYEMSQKREQERLMVEIDNRMSEKDEYLDRIDVYNKKLKDLGERPFVDPVELLQLKNQEKELRKDEEEYRFMMEKKKDLLVLESDLEKNQGKLKDAEKEKGDILAKISEKKSQLQKYEHSPEFAENKVKGLNNDFTVLSMDISIIEQNKKKTENMLKDIEKFKKDRKVLLKDIKCVETAKEAFGNAGIKSIVVDYVLPQLEDRINEVLGTLSDFRIKLDTQKKSVDGENIVEGLFIIIINGQGEQMDLASYSGGEKLKIVVSISEGLASLQKSGFRIFDEMFFALDDESIGGFSQVMLDLQSRFKQLICISHLTVIKDLFDTKLEVVKRNGVSTLC